MVIGNDHTIAILHVGEFILSIGSNSFLLKDLLYVPDIHKNLLSVSNFVKDNNVFFEFYPNCCFIKDTEARQIFLQGVKFNELNHFFPATTESKFALIDTHTTADELFQTSDSHVKFNHWHKKAWSSFF